MRSRIWPERIDARVHAVGRLEAAEPGVERVRDRDADVEGADEESGRCLDAGVDDARDDADAAERREILVAELDRALHGRVRIGHALQERLVAICRALFGLRRRMRAARAMAKVPRRKVEYRVHSAAR